MNKNWFHYLFQSKKIPLLFLSLLYFVISFSSMIGNYEFTYDTAKGVVNYAYTFSLLLTFVLPPLLFSYVHQKKSVDRYFCLPISRKQLLITSFTFGFLICFGLFACVLFAVSIATVNLGMLLKILPFSALSLFSLLAVNSFFFLCANNLFDGIVMLVAYSVYPALLEMALYAVLGVTVAGTRYYGMDNFLSKLPLYMSPAALSFSSVTMDFYNTSAFVFAKCVCLAVYGILGFIGTYRHFVNRRAERADQVSDEFSAYPLVIHAYLFTSLLNIATINVQDGFYYLIFWLALLLLVYICSTFVYRRKIVIRVRYFVIYFALLAVSLGIITVGNLTRGFGLVDHYNLTSSDKVTITYNDWKGNDNISFYLTIEEKDYEANKEILSMIDEKRMEAIDYYYSHHNSFNDDGSILNVEGLEQKKNDDVTTFSFVYSMNEPLTYEELDEVAKYTDIDVYSNDQLINWDAYKEKMGK